MSEDENQVVINISTASYNTINKYNRSKKDRSAKNKNVHEDDVTSSTEIDLQKQIGSDSPDKKNLSPSKIKKNSGKQTKKDPFIKHKPISSLFNNNPDIPIVDIKLVHQNEEHLFSTEEFSDLNIHPHLTACLRDRLKATRMTSVQQLSIPKLIEGKDALVKSSTGSGKTLAYAIPIVQALQAQEPKLQRNDGIHALIILPTRELAIQSYECFVQLCRAFTWIVPGCLMGGEKKKSEKARIRKGITILVTTPGRLLDHLEHTQNLNLQFVKWLVIDEADRLMELGFEESISNIVKKVEESSLTDRQTVLLSATLNNGVESMAGLALKNPEIIDVSCDLDDQVKLDGNFSFSVPNDLTQYLVFVPVKLRLLTLSSFLVDKCSKGKLKALIFMSAQDVVDFHFQLLTEILSTSMEESGLDIQFFKLHGNMAQQERVQTFKDFRTTKAGVLLCTDVAARGLDILSVDWIIQYSCPAKFEDYIHRIGRTARIGARGSSIIFLHPSEKAVLSLFQEHKIRITEMVLSDILPAVKLLLPSIKARRKRCPGTVEEFGTALQDLYEESTQQNNNMLELARKACIAYVRSYASYPKSMKEILPFRTLHLGHVAKSFCLQEAPTEIGSRLLNMQSQPPPYFRERNNFRRNFKRAAPVLEFQSGLGNVHVQKKKKLH